MRYPASEKLEIIRIVEQSHLPVRGRLDNLGILPGSFYRWYDRYQTGGVEALQDKSSKPSRVWNRIPDDVRQDIVSLALDEPELSPRELAARFTDTQNYFVSEASVYRLLKAHDHITSPAFIAIKAADEFKDKTSAINQLWQTDFTYLKVIGWGWFYLSTILDDDLRYIIAWKQCTTMKAEDVTDTLQLALTASGYIQARVAREPTLLSDNGRATSQPISLNGSPIRARAIFAERPIIRKPKARSSVGIRRCRTASCLRMNTCPVISKLALAASSSTTITAATTRT